MGNCNIKVPNVTDEEAVNIRNRYKKRIANTLFVNEETFLDVEGDQKEEDKSEKNNFPLCMLIHVPIESAKKISEKSGIDVPPHYVVITFGISWVCGNELVSRLPDGPRNEAMELAKTVQMDFTTMKNMQDETPFQPNESAQVMMWKFETHQETGDKGSSIVLDPILRGYSYSDDEKEEKNNTIDASRGPLHDSDYIPQHFLCIHFLRPTEYNEMSGIRVHTFVDIIRASNPCLISSPRRIHYLHDPNISQALEKAKAKSPTKMHMDGLSMDLVVRKNGRELDVVTSGRCMAPILLALEQAFDKNPVPQGTIVGAESEGRQAHLSFQCHDPNEDGKLITPETSYFEIEVLAYAVATTMKLVELGPKMERQLAMIPPGALFRKHGYIRMLKAKIFAPPEMLRKMIHDVRDAVSSGMSKDIDTDPMLLSWPKFFHGVSSRGGFAKKWKSEEEEKAGEEYLQNIKCSPFKFRFGSVGMGFFEDSQIINDDGKLENV